MRAITILGRAMKLLFLGVLLVQCSNSFAEQALKFQEGKHYLKLPEGLLENDIVENFRKSEPGRVQVIEFFSYGCSWCFKLDPYIKDWEASKPHFVSFHRVPVEFQPSWAPLTKAFYTAQSLEVLDKVHEPLFEAIHNDKIQNGSEFVLGSFFETQGVPRAKFEKTFSSFGVNRMQKWANSISQAYRITAIPAIVVQGPEGAYLSSTRLAQGEDNLLELTSWLANRQYEKLIKEHTPQVAP